MTPATIVADLLRKIPPWVRLVMNACFALAVIVVQIGRIVEAEWNFGTINEVLVYIGGYLGVQSAFNVPAEKVETSPFEMHPVNERGLVNDQLVIGLILGFVLGVVVALLLVPSLK